ncbi:unnamed protein product [Nippostrongylus brasiliensis]|uniref:SWIM-type domain-containing protein n=1 Tax=Nippostrongylus brasiliensis TaxID=27835 RepID=A0A0N4YEF3_NIPBR|nr:unnamed protein product [Nippostrongylus brasiliensis]
MDHIIKLLRKEDPTRSTKLSFVVKKDLWNLIDKYNMRPAFLLSGSMTSEDVQRMFLEIRSLMPEFAPARIVTDEAPCFYNGFRTGTLRNSVNDALRKLLKETQLEEFERKFAEVLAYLRVNNQTKMVEYLERNYLGRTPTWASFANRGAVMDTTMISERFHLRIKEEFLHRNANSRIDGFVELLIRSVEELSGAMDIKERRRFVNCAYRVTETHKRHTTAQEFYHGKDEMVVQVGPNEWRVDVSEVTWEGPCNCDPKRNTHCLKCGVCAYSWSCTCNDNRPGISCSHRHAVKMASNTPPLLAESEGTSGEHALAVCVESPITDAQQLREACLQKINAIRRMSAVVNARATSSLKSPTDDTLLELEEAYVHLELSARALENYQIDTVVARPEMSGARGNRKIAKVPLYQRRKSKKNVSLGRKSKKNVSLEEQPDSLREQMQKMSPYKGLREENDD